MYIINEIKPLPIIGKSAVAIGKFDGIHIGHQALLEKIQEQKRQKMTVVVFTFEPSPEELFKGYKLPSIDTIDEKRNNFAAMGVDYLIEYPLTKETAAISPEDFMKEILKKNLRAGYIVSGTDLSFGDKGRGNSEMLSAFCKENDIEYEMIDKICLDGLEVSSTAVREAIAKGDMELANRMLGREYSITGTVVYGKQLGRTMQIPTMNILPGTDKLLPPNGVYVTKSEIEGKVYFGMTNVGCKPTVSSENQIGVETHLFDFELDMYGKEIKTGFICYMRPEQKFEDKEALMRQLFADKERAMAYIHEWK